MKTEKEKTSFNKWLVNNDTGELIHKESYEAGKTEAISSFAEKIKFICYGKIDWIKVFKDAYEGRKTSWKELGHIGEWRNATDEVLFAFWKQFKPEIDKLAEEQSSGELTK